MLISKRFQHLWVVFGVAMLAGVVSTESVTAQQADFLFKCPKASLGVRLGHASPRAQSEVFDFTREHLTIDRSDFDGLSIDGELSVRMKRHLDAALSVGVEQSNTRSELRDWVDENNLPIEQSTRFTRVPVTLGVKAYLLERGRCVSRLAWIPKKLAPYLGAGVGIVWHNFRQIGDFVDFDTNDIFFDVFESQATSSLVYLAAGFDLSLGPRWFLSSEARYSWASAEMGPDFVGFNDIDLTGLKATVGVSIRF